MPISLSIPEFIVALFRLNPSQCQLTLTGRVANLDNFAYQVQSLLFDQVKSSYRSYRSKVIKLGTETSESFAECLSPAKARFNIDILIDALMGINIKHPSGIAALFGKDEAWSWKWSANIFIASAVFFSFLTLSYVPISDGREFLAALVIITFLSLLSTFLLSYPLRFIYDSPLLRHNFKTPYADMSVVRAEILKRIQALPESSRQLGVIPIIVEIISTDGSGAAAHTIAQLQKKIRDYQIENQAFKAECNKLSKTKSELEESIASLTEKNETLQSEIKALSAELNAKKISCAISESQCMKLTSKLNEQEQNFETEKESLANEIQKLNTEISRVTLAATESDYVKMAKVLTVVLIYCKYARAVNQNELIDFFLTVHKWVVEKYHGRFDTKLQQSTVERVFADARKTSEENGLNQDWFRDPYIIGKMIDRHHPPRLKIGKA